MKGKVKWFNNKLGYGFISSKDIIDDIYIHYSDINIDGYKNLQEGDIFEFKYDSKLKKGFYLNIISSNKIKIWV